MSIIIAGYFRIDPVHVEQCKATLIKVMRATRAEPGCRFYNITADLEDNATFHVSEEWASEAELADHMKTPHLNELKAGLGGWGLKALVLKRYDAGEGQPLAV